MQLSLSQRVVAAFAHPFRAPTCGTRGQARNWARRDLYPGGLGKLMYPFRTRANQIVVVLDDRNPAFEAVAQTPAVWGFVVRGGMDD